MIYACGCEEVDSLEGWTLERCDGHRTEPTGTWAEPARDRGELANRVHGWPRAAPDVVLEMLIAENMKGAVYRTASDRAAERVVPDPFQDAKRETARAAGKRKRLRQKAEKIIPSGG